jgi:hypothetical protein
LIRVCGDWYAYGSWGLGCQGEEGARRRRRAGKKKKSREEGTSRMGDNKGMGAVGPNILIRHFEIQT